MVEERYRSIIGEVFRFGVVGGIGFLVDAGVLFGLVRLGVGPLLARCVSFPVALAATWLLNSNWTFRTYKPAGPRVSQAASYVAVQCAGAAVNYVAYALALNLTGRSAVGSVLALAVGSAVGMLVNFAGSRLFVFKPAS